jgi:hypothetical protein
VEEDGLEEVGGDGGGGVDCNHKNTDIKIHRIDYQ